MCPCIELSDFAEFVSFLLIISFCISIEDYFRDSKYEKYMENGEMGYKVADTKIRKESEFFLNVYLSRYRF